MEKNKQTRTNAAAVEKQARTATHTTTGQADPAASFAALLRDYEQAHAAGTDNGELYALAAAVALSVVKKCIDPQRKAATERETVSNAGQSPALVSVRRGIMADLSAVASLDNAAAVAYAWRTNADGDIVTEIVDKAAAAVVDTLAGETLSDGLDIVHAAAVAIMEQAAEHASNVDLIAAAHLAAQRIESNTDLELSDGKLWAMSIESLLFSTDPADPAAAALSMDYINETLSRCKMPPISWLEVPYKLRRLSRRVIIKEADGAKWETVETTPIQEVYRAVRRAVQNSRAVQTDPRNGYLYIEDVVADPDSDKTETIYRRLHKWADLGGETRQGYYTADPQTVADYNAVLGALNMTDRQAQIVRLRMSGYGYKAIATYLGITVGAVRGQLSRLQEKCENVGFTPEMWAEMTENS